jgi:hypothetical protein
LLFVCFIQVKREKHTVVRHRSIPDIFTGNRRGGRERKERGLFFFSKTAFLHSRWNANLFLFAVTVKAKTKWLVLAF